MIILIFIWISSKCSHECSYMNVYLHLNAYIIVQYSYECSHKWSSKCSYKFSYECCHTRLHLKFSAKLKIWQVPACKMEPQSGKIMWKTPLPYLVNVFRLSSGCLKDIYMVSEQCLGGVCRVSNLMESVWMRDSAPYIFRLCREPHPPPKRLTSKISFGHKKILDTKNRFYPNLFGPNFFPGSKCFLTQTFFRLKNFWSNNLFGPHFFPDQIFFLDQTFLPKIVFWPIFFLTNCFGPNFFASFFLDTEYFGIFFTQNISGPKLLFFHIFPTQKSFGLKFFWGSDNIWPNLFYLNIFTTVFLS